jgi:hypothetical protein
VELDNLSTLRKSSLELYVLNKSFRTIVRDVQSFLKDFSRCEGIVKKPLKVARVLVGVAFTGRLGDDPRVELGHQFDAPNKLCREVGVYADRERVRRLSGLG